MNDFESVLINVIKAKRKNLKLTQKELASTLCMSKANYCKFENKQYPVTINQARKLAAIFGCSLIELIEISDFLHSNRRSAEIDSSGILQLLVQNRG